MIGEFRKFILRGNVVDLAIAVVIGASFGAVVAALVADIVTPLIAAIGGQPDFSRLIFTINESVFHYGHFLNAMLSFLMVATVVFFGMVMPMNTLLERFSPKTPGPTPTRRCPECLSDVPRAARRCAFCTSQLPPSATEDSSVNA
jgi:large conductance mechanosensitive channel